MEMYILIVTDLQSYCVVIQLFSKLYNKIFIYNKIKFVCAEIYSHKNKIKCKYRIVDNF